MGDAPQFGHSGASPGSPFFSFFSFFSMFSVCLQSGYRLHPKNAPFLPLRPTSALPHLGQRRSVGMLAVVIAICSEAVVIQVLSFQFSQIQALWMASMLVRVFGHFAQLVIFPI
jgi:hypothetical protein